MNNVSSNKYSQQRRERYHRDRKAFIEQLGGRCVHCGEDDHKKLEFHHTAPRDWFSKDFNRWTRLNKYKADHAKGIIELACRHCNASIGQPGEPDF